MSMNAQLRFSKILVMPITPIDGEREAAERTSAAADQLNVLRADQLPEQPPSVFYGPFAHETLERISEAGRERARILQKWADLVNAHGRVQTILRVGEPSRQIIAAAEGMDLIVIYLHAQGWIRDRVLGSVAKRVIRLATCPGLTLRPGRHDIGRGLAAVPSPAA
jgi:nucleotide-binding universal stress UspA family protein